ncbi:MAG: ATP-binding cassette domain-containing protein [Anaerolineaceae bacterium]|nr:ATP-binding cassette domain-containing protein [Anaerolineaceae bacterium]
MNNNKKPILKVDNLSKYFGTLPVVQRVSFDINPGEVVGLTGSIGSGKSVIAMMIAGLYKSNQGRIEFAGKELVWPFPSKKHGIAVIHQKPHLQDHYDVVSNLFLGNEIGKLSKLGWLRIIDQKGMDRKAKQIVEQLGIEISSLNEKVYNLSGELRQMIAIGRTLTYNAKMVIIDEPTLMLGYPYQQRLLALIQNWRQQGVSVLFTSNNLDHLFAVTDRIIVLHQGRKLADLITDETNRKSVVDLLLGLGNPQLPDPAILDLDSYNRIRENSEKLRYHQMMVGKDMAIGPGLNRQLTEQLAEQVQALDQANLALLEAQRRLIAEREEERKHVAREIHDQVIQDLLSINYELEDMETVVPVSKTLTNDLTDVRQNIRELVDNLRNICGNLRPPTIDSLGLGAALQSYARDWTSRTGVKVSLKLDENLGRLPESAELSIFRIVQEGLSNIWHHADATKVDIVLEHTSPRTLMISIADDGRGGLEDFDLTKLANNGHFGLIGINERVALLDGRFRIQEGNNKGTILLVEIPHPRIHTIPEEISIY